MLLKSMSGTQGLLYRGTLLIRQTMGHTDLAILTGGSNFMAGLIRKCVGVSPGQKKSGRNNHVPVITRWLY